MELWDIWVIFSSKTSNLVNILHYCLMEKAGNIVWHYYFWIRNLELEYWKCSWRDNFVFCRLKKLFFVSNYTYNRYLFKVKKDYSPKSCDSEVKRVGNRDCGYYIKTQIRASCYCAASASSLAVVLCYYSIWHSLQKLPSSAAVVRQCRHVLWINHEVSIELCN